MTMLRKFISFFCTEYTGEFVVFYRDGREVYSSRFRGTCFGYGRDLEAEYLALGISKMSRKSNRTNRRYFWSSPWAVLEFRYVNGILGLGGFPLYLTSRSSPRAPWRQTRPRRYLSKLSPRLHLQVFATVKRLALHGGLCRFGREFGGMFIERDNSAGFVDSAEDVAVGRIKGDLVGGPADERIVGF